MPQPTSYPQPDPETLDAFLRELRNTFPGGLLISDQWHTQPFTPLLLRSRPDTNDPIVVAALDTYPSLNIPVLAFDGEPRPWTFFTPTLRIVPRFVDDLIRYHTPATNDSQHNLGPDTPMWTSHPDDEQITTFISQLRGLDDTVLMPYPEPALLTGLAGAVASAGWHDGTTLLNNHLRHRTAQGDTTDDLYAAVHTLGTALRAATH